MHGLDEAIARVNACAHAGADAAFVEAPQSIEELERIPREVRLPNLANMLTGGATPIVPVPRLQEMGYKIAVAPIESLMVCGQAVRSLSQAWLREGRVDGLAAQAMSFAELKALLRVDEHLDGRVLSRNPSSS